MNNHGRVGQINIETYVNNYHRALDEETKISNAGWKVTPSQKVALEQIAKSNGLTVSGLIQEAVDLYMQYLQHVNSLRNNEDIIIPLLKRL